MESAENNFSEVEIRIILPPVVTPPEEPADEPKPPPSDFLPVPDRPNIETEQPLREEFQRKTIRFSQREVARDYQPRFIGVVPSHRATISKKSP